MSALPVHQTSAKVSQVTNIFLPSRILAIDVVLYAAKSFKNEIKHMNAKACALFFTRYNNSTSSSQQHSVSLRSALIGNKVLMPLTSSFSFWPGGSSGSVNLGAWSRSEAPLCVSWSGACFSPSAGAVGGGRRDWHAKSWTASKMAPESHSSGASGKPGCSSGPLWLTAASSSVQWEQCNREK